MDLKINYAFVRFAHIFFRNKRKNKKKESRYYGGVAALSRFLEKILPVLKVLSGQSSWQLNKWEDAGTSLALRVEIFFKTVGLTLTVLWRLV